MGSDFRLIQRHLNLCELTVRTWIGVEVQSERQVLGHGLMKHNVAAHARLFGARIISLITLLLVPIADQDTLLSFRVHLPPLLLRYVHICYATEDSQVSQVRLRSSIQLVRRHFVSDPVLDVYRCDVDLGV